MDESVNVTIEDIQQVLNEDEVFNLKVRLAALNRKNRELQKHIEELEQNQCQCGDEVSAKRNTKSSD